MGGGYLIGKVILEVWFTEIWCFLIVLGMAHCKQAGLAEVDGVDKM